MHFASASATVVLAFVLSARREHLNGATTSIRRKFSGTSSVLSSSSSSSSDDSEDGGAEKYNRLLEWIRQQEGSFVSPRIAIKPSSLIGGGYGAFCQETVAQDELLFAIPRRACITLADAIADADCGAIFQKVMEKAGPGGNTVVMAGFMAKERLQSLEHQENKKKASTAIAASIADAEDASVSINNPLVLPDDSRFGPYLATLPWERGVNNQEHALFWTSDDVESYLHGTMCHDEVKELRNEVELAISVLDKIMSTSIRKMRNRNGNGDVSDKNGFKWPWETAKMTAAQLDKEQGPVEGLPEAIKGAFVSLLTRAFQDDADGSNDDDESSSSNGEEKMVPLLDLLQHGNDPNVRHAMRLADGTVEVRARRDLMAGEELLNQYRAETEVTMPFHRFFTRYGFVPGIQEPMLNLLKDRSPIFFAQKAEV
jgi:SET domain